MSKFYGSDLTAYFRAESTFDTSVLPTAGTALRVTSATFGMPEGRAIPGDRRGTRSRMSRTEARQPPQPWALAGILRPSGTLGTPPEIGNLLTHTLGNEDITASTNVAYNLLKDMSALSASIYRIEDELLEGVSGAIVQTFSLNWSGEDHITWSASGEAASYIEAGRSLADGAGSSSTSLTVDDADNFTAGGVIQVGSDNNGGLGIRIASVNYTTNVLTLGTAATWSDNDVVQGYAPAPAYIGDELFGIDGSVSLDNGSTTVTTQGGSVTINTGLSLLNSSFGQSKPEEVLNSGMREVTCSLDLIADTTNTYLAKEMRRKTSYDVLISLGDTATKRLKINMDNVEFDPEQRDSPEAEPLRQSVPGIALGTSGEDEIDLLQD